MAIVLKIVHHQWVCDVSLIDAFAIHHGLHHAIHRFAV